MKNVKMIKKMMAVAAAVTVCATAMTGCGKTETSEKNKTENAYADTITLVWYPNESAENFEGPRDEVGKLIEKFENAEGKDKRFLAFALKEKSLPPIYTASAPYLKAVLAFSKD
mgnify:CR=1 FL=1